jgi:DNA (cytosine-5)-methyltransferase 1
MRFLSVCSGIEAASVAWNPLGWKAAAFSEIEPFPCAVLAHHYPDVPNRGDMTKFEEWPLEPIDLLCGGTPCQSFSVAGLRKGLDDPRGNLMLTFGAIAARYRPRWLVWENVPGVLSSNGGRDFGSFLGMLGQLGYGFAYRVLDAQYFGLAQRRKRVFVVGCLGDWRSAAAVLFERHSLQGHPAPSRQAREGIAAATAPGVAFGGNNTSGAIDTAAGLNAKGGAGRMDFDSETFITGTLNANGKVAGSATQQDAECGMLVPLAFDTYNQAVTGDTSQTLCSRGDTPGGNAHLVPAVAFQSSQSGVREVDSHATLDANNGSRRHNGVVQAMQVRRLTPRECERLQGFPDHYTAVLHRGKPAADGPRYKALGNSWAVPNVRWIGRRIDQVQALIDQREEIAA